MRALTTFISRIDVTHFIAMHVVGNNYTKRHRKIAGLLVMILGVLIAKSALLVNSTILHIGADVVGFAVHAFVAGPYIEAGAQITDYGTNTANDHALPGDDTDPCLDCMVHS